MYELGLDSLNLYVPTSSLTMSRWPADEAAMTAWKQAMKDRHKVSEDKVAQIVDMQHMTAG